MMYIWFKKNLSILYIMNSIFLVRYFWYRYWVDNDNMDIFWLFFFIVKLYLIGYFMYNFSYLSLGNTYVWNEMEEKFWFDVWKVRNY